MPADAQHPPDLTVALPTYNGARHLAGALRSVLAQGDDFDLLLRDDRSDDDTLAVARSVAGDRARIVENPQRLGLAGNWNACVAAARTPLVAVFHQDDLMRPGHLAAHRRAFASDPSAVLIASASGVIDSEGRPVPPSVVAPGGLGGSDRVFARGEAVAAMAESNPLRCSAVTIRADAHASVGGFDPTLRYVVDWDLWLRLADVGSVSWIRRETVDIRWHVDSETHRFATGIADLEETRRLIDRLFARADLPGPRRLRRAADRRLARAYLNRAHVALRAGDEEVAGVALREAIRLRPGIVGTIALDPRLAAQMAALVVAPRWAGRAFRRRGRSSGRGGIEQGSRTE